MATDRVGIEIEILGYNEAINQMRNLERTMKGISGIRLRIQAKNRLKELQRNAVGLRSELERLRSAQAGVEKGSAAWDSYAQRMRQVRREMAQTAAEAQRMRNVLNSTMSVGQMFKGNTSAVAHLGSAMQSAGNAITRFMAPFRMLTTGMFLGVGFGAIGKITDGLKSGFSRYDTMKKYPQMMAEYSKESYTAEQSINDLDQAVRGLPTGLDEIVQMSQRFTLSLGDMKQGTDLAIAANNAFLASMATDTQKYQGMLQLQDLMNGKKLQSREWMSLGSSMGKAINEIGKEFGYTNKNMGEFRKELYAGEISTEDFLNALVKVGTGTGKIAKLAELSKQTWEAFSANIGNAFSRMMYGVLTSLDEISKAVTGKTVNALLTDKVIPGIDKMTKSIKAWIKANPDKILDFFNAMKSVDWAGLGRGFVKGLGDIVKFVQKIAEKFDGKSLEGLGNFFSKLMILAPMLTVGGGLLKGTRHILGGFLTGIQLIIGTLSGVGIAKAIKNLGKIKSLFKGLGGIFKAASAIGGASTAATAAGAIFKGFLPAIEIIGGIGAVVTELAGFAALDTWLVKKAIDNVLGITDGISDIYASVKKVKGEFGSSQESSLRKAVNGIFSMYDIIYGEKKGKTAASGLTKGAAGVQREDGLRQMKGGALKKIANSIEQMNSIFSQMNGIRKNLKALKKFKGFKEGDIDKIGDFVTGIGDIYDSLDQSFKNGFDTEQATEFSGIIGQAKTMFGTLGELGKLIPTIQKNLAPLVQRGVGGMGYSVIDQLKASLTGEEGLFAGLGEIYQSINEDFLGGAYFKKGKLKDVGSFDEAMASVKSMFESLGGITEMIPTIQSSLAKMTNQGSGRGSFLGVFKQNIVQLMQSIGEISASVDTDIGDTSTLATKMEGLKTAISNIKSAVTTLSSLGSGGLASTGTETFTAIDNVKEMVTRLGQSLNTETISTLQMQVSQFKTAVDGIFKTLNGDLESVKVEVHIDGKVTGVDELLSEIRSANSRIRSAVRAIQNSYTRYVYIHVVPQVSVGAVPKVSIPGATGSDAGNYRGGYISGHGTLYRHKGGDIFRSIFKPKGVDTVPAMLQPGEYVQRKAAVDYFGVKFMQKINNLDVRGAMRELSARVGTSSVMARGMTVYNNITNNNQTVNQNVNTNNPNFAFKRSRYMAAL